jgi:hypothetical protein
MMSRQHRGSHVRPLSLCVGEGGGE